MTFNPKLDLTFNRVVDVPKESVWFSRCRGKPSPAKSNPRDFVDNQFFGASAAILSSASSKMAYGTAHEMGKRGDVKIIGLTSSSNVAFCESLD